MAPPITDTETARARQARSVAKRAANKALAKPPAAEPTKLSPSTKTRIHAGANRVIGPLPPGSTPLQIVEHLLARDAAMILVGGLAFMPQSAKEATEQARVWSAIAADMRRANGLPAKAPAEPPAPTPAPALEATRAVEPTLLKQAAKLADRAVAAAARRALEETDQTQAP